MKILCIGDIVGKPGRKLLDELLPGIKKEYGIDLTVVNGENAAAGSGITPAIADHFFATGCDVITLGDHTWDKPELAEYLQKKENIIRPANFPEGNPGRGWCVVKTGKGKKVAVINLLGRVFMRYNVDCPFRMMDKLTTEIRRDTDIILLDFHTETTSEKVAMGFYLDGKISALVGTHTHIQTADEKILPKGTAYITDLGMTGPYDSVIGQNKEKIIERFLTSRPIRFEVAEGNPVLHGVVIDVDDNTGLASDIVRVQRKLA